MEIRRIVEDSLKKQLGKQKVLLLFGTRRTGKSTIAENITADNSGALLLQGEDLQVASILQDRTLAGYTRLTQGKKLIIIDEAQAVPNIGLILKFMIDNIKGITVIATGSSSFDLQSMAGEPLVGRTIVYTLYPIAQIELSRQEDFITTSRNLEQRLIYGSYPELWHLDSDNEKEIYLKQLVNNYLLKDILAFEKIKGADVLYRLLQMLAFQIGSEVNTTELANKLSITRPTVERYLDLLRKVFIIFPLSAYSNNLRKEISKKKKWFFYDNGIRNALISNFSLPANRADTGQLWEQYILSERIKMNSYAGYFPQYYFWRTFDGQEIDFIEVNNKQQITAAECKWNKDNFKTPLAFLKTYPDVKVSLINQKNYLAWISGG
jgi:predicted AAA+ superfamily ATPase